MSAIPALNSLNSSSSSATLVLHSPINIGRFTLLFDEGESAKQLLLESDDYLQRMSNRERATRMQAYVPYSNSGIGAEMILREDVTEEEFRSYVVKQIRPWKEHEMQKVCSVFEKIHALAKGLIIHLPEIVHLVKTNGFEEIREADAYCRSHTIVLKQATVNKELLSILIHELFHIQSQVDPVKRKELYALVGFTECNEVALPSELATMRLTNPDAPKLNVRMTVTIGEEKVAIVPVLLYDENRGDSFLKRLYIQLLAIENVGSEEKEEWKYREEGGLAKIIDPNECKDFHSQNGNNTKYNFHPDEILADNFVFMLLNRNVPNPRLLDDIRTLFQGQV
jgi:hypothetical protein